MGKLLRCLRMWNCHFWTPSNYCGTWHVQGAEFGAMPLLESNLASWIGLAPCPVEKGLEPEAVFKRGLIELQSQTMFCGAPRDKAWSKTRERNVLHISPMGPSTAGSWSPWEPWRSTFSRWCHTQVKLSEYWQTLTRGNLLWATGTGWGHFFGTPSNTLGVTAGVNGPAEANGSKIVW